MFRFLGSPSEFVRTFWMANGFVVNTLAYTASVLILETGVALGGQLMQIFLTDPI